MVAIFGLMLLLALVYFFYLGEAHDAYPWRKQRKALMDLAADYGLEVHESQRKAAGELEGLPFSIGVSTVRTSKSKVVKLGTKLEVPACPAGLSLNCEDLLSGIAKAFSYDELSLGDPEFDAVFEIHGESVDVVKSYLTPEIRSGLLRYFSKLPHGVLRSQEIRSEKRFLTPFFMASHFKPLLERNRLLAASLQGRVEPLKPGQSSGIVEQKLRRFCRLTILIWLIPFLVTLKASSELSELALPFVFGVGTLLTTAALSAKETARVFLQGYYAFITLFVAIMIFFGLLDGTEIYEPRWLDLVDQEYIGYFLVTSVVFFTCWGTRNYLKTLDQTRVVVRDSEDKLHGL